MPVKAPDRKAEIVNFVPPKGWNPDATESSIPKGDFIEARNFRKPHNDEWEVRSGFTKWTWDNYYPVGACEYEFDSTYINVLFYESGGSLYAKAFDGDTIEVTIGPIANTIPFSAAHFEVQAVQNNTYLILTVYGVGIFAIFPNGTHPNELTSWDFIELGKLLTPTPKAYTFADKTTGDLILYQYITPPANGGTDCKGQFADGANEPIKIRVPVGAPYTLISGNMVLQTAANLLKDFESESVDPANDGDKHFVLRNTVGPVHLQKRGWFYKFLMQFTITDVRGQTFTYYHEASVDIFVPDMNYAPPFLANHESTDRQLSKLDAIGDVFTVWSDKLYRDDSIDMKIYPSGEVIASGGTVTDPDWLSFQKKWKAYFHDDKLIDSPDDAGNYHGSDTMDPFWFASRVLGMSSWTGGNVHNAPASFFYIYPYKLSVAASELFGAPQTLFKWSDFDLPAVPTGIKITAIEIYRTAHIDNPEYAPNVYGLAGTLNAPEAPETDSSFTDATADWNLDLNGRTSSEEGYLQGECSGKTIRVYNNNIRIGDTVTELNIRTPSILVQAFAFDYANDSGTAGSGLIAKAQLTDDAGDGLPTIAFGYQYADNANHFSDIRDFPVDVESGLPSDVGVAFTFPHGYNDTITNIYLFEGHYSGGVRTWRRIGIIDVTNGHFIYQGLSGTDWANKPEMTATAPDISKDRGACIWSEGADMFLWPQENFELEHEFAPVTHIDCVVGPALIHTTRSCVHTTFGIDSRWEEIHDRLGCISRMAAIRVGKVEFFLSAAGLYIAEGYSVRPFPAMVQQEIRKYTSEVIPGQQPLANASRASLGWLGNRNELWLHFPGSNDLGGILPPATFIYRLYFDYGDYTARFTENYLFDIIPPQIEVTDLGVPVYFISSANGKLYALFYRKTLHPTVVQTMVFIDCDADTDWPGDAYLTASFALGRPSEKKILSDFSMFYDRNCNMEYATGMRRTDGIEDDLTYGLLKSECEIVSVPQPDQIYRQAFTENISQNIENIQDYTPLVRIHTSPDTGGNHFMRIQALSLRLNVETDANVTDT